MTAQSPQSAVVAHHVDDRRKPSRRRRSSQKEIGSGAVESSARYRRAARLPSARESG